MVIRQLTVETRLIMTEPEQVTNFCEMVDEKEKAEISIIEVSYLRGFVKYDLQTKDGNVDVVRSY